LTDQMIDLSKTLYFFFKLLFCGKLDHFERISWYTRFSYRKT